MSDSISEPIQVLTKFEESGHANKLPSSTRPSYVETASCGSTDEDVAVTKVPSAECEEVLAPVESSKLDNKSMSTDDEILEGKGAENEPNQPSSASGQIRHEETVASSHAQNLTTADTSEDVTSDGEEDTRNSGIRAAADEHGGENRFAASREPDQVSDISASSSGSSFSDDLFNIDTEMGLQTEGNNSIANGKNLTICSVISNTSDHESIRSQRENVDRLLMSSGGYPRSTRSVGGSSIPGAESDHDFSASYAYSYDTNYYKSTDWLRLIPRRSSAGENLSSSEDDHATFSSGNVSFPFHQQNRHVEGSALSPDHFWRGFDNTRIRAKPLHHNGATTRRRSAESTSSPHLHYLGSQTRAVFTDVISTRIDEEEGGVEGAASTNDLQQPVHSGSLIPSVIQCLPPVNVENFNEEMQPRHIISIQPPRNEALIAQGATGGPEEQTGSQFMPNLSHEVPVEAGARFESSLRVGGIVRPEHQSHIHYNQLPPHLEEQQMHLASWDSKFETYACRVDQSQEDSSVEIPLFSMARPHMRAFHYAWLTFFFAFLAWFSITPLLSEVQKSLNLTKEQIWTSSIFGVAGAVISRCISGVFCDMYGARLISAAVLFICGIPTMCTGLVNTSIGLSILRLVIGIAGSAFVTCQYWTSTMFTREVAGTANALAAGWGNLGGGIAQVLVGSILFPFFKLIYSSAGTAVDPAELSWRTCCIIPGLICTVFTFFVIRYSDDSPKGNYYKRRKLGLMQNQSPMKYFKFALSDHNTWIMAIQYGCCFGVELTTTNAAALYFKEEFELSTEAAAAIASSFGWMNLFARGLGGFLSDVSNVYSGMRGRLIWQLVCFVLEGIFVVVFSKARSLAGAVTALITFSLFVQGAEGSTFGIVPYLNPGLTGTIAGIIGAGGNAGAVIFSILFRQFDYRTAFFWMGAATIAISTLSCLVWIRGYQGLFLRRRLLSHDVKPRRSFEESQAANSSGTQNLEQTFQNGDVKAVVERPGSFVG
ncbi:hypothetical protein ACHAXS_012580 [Conticribra weissflogii]